MTNSLLTMNETLIFTEAQTLADFNRDTAEEERVLARKLEQIRQRKLFRRRVIHIWKSDPALTLGEVLKRKATR